MSAAVASAVLSGFWHSSFGFHSSFLFGIHHLRHDSLRHRLRHSSFVEGRKLVLGGVEIPYSRGLEGHSDADVLAHAIADALLGAISAGDIGQQFSGYRQVDSRYQQHRNFETSERIARAKKRASREYRMQRFSRRTKIRAAR